MKCNDSDLDHYLCLKPPPQQTADPGNVWVHHQCDRVHLG